MADDQEEPDRYPRVLDYARGRMKPRKVKPTRAEVDRRERTAAFWIIGGAVALPFLLMAWFLSRLTHR